MRAEAAGTCRPAMLQPALVADASHITVNELLLLPPPTRRPCPSVPLMLPESRVSLSGD